MKAPAGLAEAATAMLLVGSSVGVSSLLVDYPVLTGQATRYAVAAALLCVFGLATGRLVPPTGGEAARLALLAMVGLAAFNVFLVLALESAEPAAVGVVVGGVPIALAILGPLQRRDSPRPTLIAAAVVVVAGAALVQGSGRASALGLLLSAFALLAEVAFTLLAVPVLPRLGPTTVSAAGCGLAAIQLAVAAPLLHGRAAFTIPSGTELFAIIYLAIVVTAIAFVLWYDGVYRAGSDIAGLFAGLIPVGALFTGWLVGTGKLDAGQVIGTALVAAAITGALALPSSRQTVEAKTPM
jgi:drug/metabolite transporter (DMT)-like permease